MTFHSRDIKINWGHSDLELKLVFEEVRDD
jgi:hypothetical protein